jgi:hypothetical protein
LLVAGPILGGSMSRREHDAELEDARARAIAELEVLHAGREIDAPEYERRRSSTRSRSSPPLQSAPRPSSRTPPTSTARSSRSSRASAARGPGSLRRISAC